MKNVSLKLATAMAINLSLTGCFPGLFGIAGVDDTQRAESSASSAGSKASKASEDVAAIDSRVSTIESSIAKMAVILDGSSVVGTVISTDNDSVTILTPQGYAQQLDLWTGELFDYSHFYEADSGLDYSYQVSFTSADCSGAAYINKPFRPNQQIRVGNFYYRSTNIHAAGSLTFLSKVDPASGSCQAANVANTARTTQVQEISAPNDLSSLAPLQITQQ
jgi:hypothetical protein